MTKRRELLLWAVVGVLLLTVGAGVYGGFRWLQFKREHGIVAFDVSGLRLSAASLSVRQIVVIQQAVADERLALRVNGLQLDVDSWWQPLPLRSLSIDHLEAQWQPAPDDSDVSEDEPLALPGRAQLERWATWIPRQGHIASLALVLPCTSGTCREQGQMQWQHAGKQALPAEVSVQLQRNTHRLALLADAYEQDDETHVSFQLQLDGQQRLTMQNQLTPEGSATRWRGSLAMSELPEAPWLLEWLAEWSDYAPPPLPQLPQLPEQMRIGAGWALYVDGNALGGGWKALEGDFRLSANLPAPWPIAELGQLQGQLDLTAKVDRGSWIPTALAADMQLQPTAALIGELPAQLRPADVRLVVTPGPASESASTLPLKIQLTARGPSPVTLDAQLMFKTTAPFAVAFEQTRLSLRSPALSLQDIAMTDLKADLRLSCRASEEKVVVRLDNGSQLTLGSLSSGTAITAEKLQLDMAGIGLEASLAEQQLQRLLIDGRAAVNVAKLRQSSLRPQGWRWSGTLNGDRERISLDGSLDNDAGLTLPLTLTRNWASGAIRLDAKLPELFLRAGNPLAATLAGWPQVLELNTGRLQAQGQLDVPASGPPTATATLTAKGLGGIYDRTELSGLDASLALALQRNQLRLDIQELTLLQANPGFTFGPLRFNGEYAGNLERLDRGRLAWTTAEVQLLGGRLWLDPGAADLAANEQQLTAHLRGLQLPLLLEAYPTEGLSGTGVIDGELQLLRNEAGVSIEQGSLQAREPGGVLQFRSAKIQALGQSNPAMRLVTEALDDFHYDLLASDVQYAADGTLDLGLKLHGRNPALEGGRPINFSINLEEDIPALLTSLQLSDRVSETIQRRVQERLR